MPDTQPLSIVRHVPDEALPWVDAGDGVELKVLRVDEPAGRWVVRNRFQPGVTVQRHLHTGPVHGFTIAGRWTYPEYGEYYTAGSFIMEPAGSIHTLVVPEDNDEITDVIFDMEGANLNLDENDEVESVFNGPNTLAAYLALCEAQGFDAPTGILG